MAQYLIESPHTDEECLQALDDIAAQQNELLGNCYFACQMGDHRGWAVVDKGSEAEAANLLPESLRSKARVYMVDQFTPEQIRSFHEMH